MANEPIKKVNEAINRMFDIPEAYGLNLPKITLLGNIQLYIENHQGISLYQSDLVKVVCLYGMLVVRGQEMVLRSIEKDELYIDGRIDAIEYQLH